MSNEKVKLCTDCMHCNYVWQDNLVTRQIVGYVCGRYKNYPLVDKFNDHSLVTGYSLTLHCTEERTGKSNPDRLEDSNTVKAGRCGADALFWEPKNKLSTNWFKRAWAYWNS